MKTLILSLLLVATTAAIAQMFTNNVAVVYSAQQRDLVQAMNDLDNNLRTNGFAPYTNVQASRTLLQYFAAQAGQGLQTQAEVDYPRREAELLAALRAATPTKRLAAMKAAWTQLQ